MRIAQIHTGLIEIPPKGWGAVEKVIYNYQKQMVAAGHTCDIKYMNEVSAGEYDIVHVHMANQALYLAERNIPYIFSIHDHHAEFYGVDSPVYKENHAAIKKSVFSITHAWHYKELFPDCQQLFFLSHGVDTEFYREAKKDSLDQNIMSLVSQILMVATNGLAGDISIDRKGFLKGIEIAKELQVPIFLTGSEANKDFQQAHQQVMKAPFLSLDFSNPSQEKILKYYQKSHFFLHLSDIEAGMPNLTLLEALACGLKVIANGRNFPEMLYKISNFYHVKDEIEAKHVINELIRNKNHQHTFNDNVSSITAIKLHFDWSVIVARLLKMYEAVLLNPVIDTAQTTQKYRELLNI